MDHQSSANSENLVSSQPLESEKPNQQLTSIYSENLDEKTQSASQTCERNNEEKIGVKEMDSGGEDIVITISEESVAGGEEGNLDIEDSGRERLKRHRVEMAGRVWIPDLWGQEEFLQDWIDCAAFGASFVTSRILTARAALVEERSRPNTGGFRIENRC